MTRKTRRTASATLAVLAALALAGGAEAQEKYKLDPDHTNVMWMISHGGWANVIGQFRKVEGELTFDAAAPEKSTLRAVVEAASLDSNHFYRDNFVRSDQFLDARQHKDITFTATRVEKTGEKTGKMTGDLAMKGVTRPVTFDVTYNRGAAHPSGRFIVGFSAKTKIKRSDWGISGFLPFVGDEVDIIIETEFLRQ
ncbi:MAG: YceI family protein [Alphaproteobacteria bacterium]|nr:YceI family protein [Alphaproteobacteria bacterium]